MLLNLAGRGLRRVLPLTSMGGTERGPVWSPDGAWIAFAGTGEQPEPAGTSVHFWAVPIDDSSPRQVSVSRGFRSASSLSSQAGVMAFSLERPEGPPEVHVIDLISGTEIRVSSVNQGVPRPAMGRTEVMAWTAPDGTPLQGLLTRPPDPGRPGPSPLAVLLHGGPGGAFAESFREQAVLSLAADGLQWENR